VPTDSALVNRHRLLILATLASTTVGAHTLGAARATRPEARAAGDSTVTLLGYKSKVPASWLVRPPSSSSRLAQFVIHGSDGGSDAEVVAFFFGATPGGNVDANLDRWRSQFSTPDGSPVPETVTRDSTGAFPVTTAEFRGTYRRGVGAGSADSVRAGQTLVASIVETPHGTLFIQLFGPIGTVAAHRAEFAKFVKELK
jgi:hypothetical protein